MLGFGSVSMVTKNIISNINSALKNVSIETGLWLIFDQHFIVLQFNHSFFQPLFLQRKSNMVTNSGACPFSIDAK